MKLLPPTRCLAITRD